jgi:hypothetical protein
MIARNVSPRNVEDSARRERLDVAKGLVEITLLDLGHITDEMSVESVYLKRI